MYTKLTNNGVLFLFALILSWVCEVYLQYYNQRDYLFFTKSTSIIILVLYYINSVKKTNKLVIILFVIFLITGFFFSKNDYNYLGMLGVSVSRIWMIVILCSFKEKLDKKLLSLILIVCSLIITVLVFILFKNTYFYYISAIATYFLIALLSITFTRLINFGMRKGNLEFFLAVAIFLVSDAFFGSQKLVQTHILNIIISSTSYLIAYLLITISLKKKGNCID